MLVQFLGTRGEIKIRSDLHQRHTVLLVRVGRRKILFDWGADWRAALQPNVDALFLTHAHEDHVLGLRDGFQAPVYATQRAFHGIKSFPIERNVVVPGKEIDIVGFRVTAIAVEHSIRAPCVGYRIEADGWKVFYCPDVARIPCAKEMLAGVQIYIGDGSSINRPILRYSGGRRIGHASIRQQLKWCSESGVKRAIFTHCGSQVVRDHAAAVALVRKFGKAYGVRTQLATDGMTVVCRVETSRTPTRQRRKAGKPMRASDVP